jgi:ABC-type dipeptide/oligopeptide/nickel transport system permease subunit
MSSPVDELTVREHEREQALQDEEMLQGRPFESHRATQGIVSELWADKAGFLGATFLVVLLICAVFAPLVAPHDPAAQSLTDRLTPPAWDDGGSWTHVLGTDNLGRDVLSRIIHGSRVSLLVGFSVVVIAGFVGVLLGLISGYRGGRTDRWIMGFVDTQVAFPGLLLALIILAVVGPSVGALIVVLAINGWMVYARVTRGVVLSVKELPYVEAAEIVGCKPRRVVARHILPNLVSSLSTLAVLEFARIVLAEAALSFLGLGDPTRISWGSMLENGFDSGAPSAGAWWYVIPPGLCITVLVFVIGLVGYLFEQQVNPRLQERA